MLDVVFLKELQIIRIASDRQGFFELARLKESPQAQVCPQCLSGSIYCHGHFSRMVCLEGNGEAIKLSMIPSSTPYRINAGREPFTPPKNVLTAKQTRGLWNGIGSK